QTETEATGAPQKHHYTLNQQVGSITPVSENESFLEFSNHGPVFRAHFKKAQLDALSSAPAVLKLP
ncbi:hypothetical protein NXF61_27355, partial [Klebsiella pneumoniae]|nr:hypothetical protein [Klebsiella pneumoniae]